MDSDPRSWGPVAQGALVLLIVARIPSALATPDTVEMAGALTGVVLGAFIVVALGRAVYRWASSALPDVNPFERAG